MDGFGFPTQTSVPTTAVPLSCAFEVATGVVILVVDRETSVRYTINKSSNRRAVASSKHKYAKTTLISKLF